MKKKITIFAGLMMVLLAACEQTRVCPTYLKNTKPHHVVAVKV